MSAAPMSHPDERPVIVIPQRGGRRRDRRVAHGETVGRRMPLVRTHPAEDSAATPWSDAAPSPEEELIAREERDLFDLLQLSQALTGIVAEQQPLQRRAIAQRHVETWIRCQVDQVPVPGATRWWIHAHRSEFDDVLAELRDVYHAVKRS